MILVIGGTSDGRAIAREIAGKGVAVLVSTATGYGSDLAARDGIPVVQGRLDSREMFDLIVSRTVRVLVDASHPFAVEVSRNAAGACGKAGIPYIRYARPGGEVPGGPMVETAESYQEAARRACELGRTIFLAAGSKTAGIFLETARDRGRRIVIRVIPDPGVIRRLLDMGFSPADVAAVQGPFSEEMNMALMRHYRADVLVTKESGREGGLAEKISAAAKLGLPVVVVKRPPEPPGAARSVEEAVERALKYFRQLMNEGNGN
ncbi:MAG: precorrin-6A reductase [Peptococcaceae bacterium]|nr:precorrin-6A reductase [Peptococcaceae bacterium]